jgi:hypothetical protein
VGAIMVWRANETGLRMSETCQNTRMLLHRSAFNRTINWSHKRAKAEQTWAFRGAAGKD